MRIRRHAVVLIQAPRARRRTMPRTFRPTACYGRCIACRSWRDRTPSQRGRDRIANRPLGHRCQRPAQETGCNMKADVINAVRSLRLIKDGHVYKPHDVRFLLAQARELEEQLEKWQMAIWNIRHKAEKAFIEGWPNATKAPWVID